MTHIKDDSSISSPIAHLSSIAIGRLVGYALLILSVLDLIAIIYPPQLMNPAWELPAMGAIVDHLLAPLLGFFLVFLGEGLIRNKFEKSLIKVLSWLSLLIAICLLLIIPLIINDTLRLNHINPEKLTSEYQQQVNQLNQADKQLSAASNVDIEKMKSKTPELDGKNPEEVKKQLADKITETRQQIEARYTQALASQKLNLLKNSVKWSLGALICAVLFMCIWSATRWAR